MRIDVLYIAQDWKLIVSLNNLVRVVIAYTNYIKNMPHQLFITYMIFTHMNFREPQAYNRSPINRLTYSLRK